jgi:predicted GNAT family N-acyltransferase
MWDLQRIGKDASVQVIAEITRFNNEYLPQSPRRLARNQRRYENADSLFLTLRVSGKLIGLLEASSQDTHMLLETLIVDRQYRGQRLSQVLFDAFLTHIEPQTKIVVRFRDGNKPHLEKLYGDFGFSKAETDGAYRNGEIRWKMTRA